MSGVGLEFYGVSVFRQEPESEGQVPDTPEALGIVAVALERQTLLLV